MRHVSDQYHVIIHSDKMANRDLMDLNGPINDAVARKMQHMAITRDYISQPRLSKLHFELKMSAMRLLFFLEYRFDIMWASGEFDLRIEDGQEPHHKISMLISMVFAIWFVLTLFILCLLMLI